MFCFIGMPQIGKVDVIASVSTTLRRFATSKSRSVDALLSFSSNNSVLSIETQIIHLVNERVSSPE